MSAASQVEAETIAPADISEALERLRAGHVFVEFRDDSVAARAAGLDILLAHFPEAKLVWIGNPLRSPLTIERVFLQAVGPEADLRVERSPEELAAMLRAAATGAAPEAHRCLLILHQPETLDAEARDKLAAIAPLLTGASPAIQFLFCATSAFRPIALPPAAITLYTPASPNGPPTAIDCLEYATIPHDRPSQPGRLPRLVILVLAILTVLVTASVTNPPPPSPPPIDIGADTPTTRTAALPAPTPDPVSASAASDPAATTTPRTDVTVLRHEFDAFLAHQPPRLATLTPEQRDALFDEFVHRQNRRDKTAP